jgi:peptide/nickel transport system substrate-binding protein
MDGQVLSRRIVGLVVAVGVMIGLSAAGFSRSEAQNVVTVVVGQAGDVPSMDPDKVRGQFGGNVLFNLYEGLTALSPTSAVIPALATSWRAVDATTWQFTLRKGVKFQNGVPFTSAAVAYSFKRLMDPTKPRLNANFQGVAKLDVVDDYTVNITTKGNDPWLPQKVSELFVVEPGHAEQVGEDGMATSPMGTGAYRLVQWDHDQQVVLEAWPGYWRGKPRVDRRVFSVITESTTRHAEVLKGHNHQIEDV